MHKGIQNYVSESFRQQLHKLLMTRPNVSTYALQGFRIFSEHSENEWSEVLRENFFEGYRRVP